MKKLLVVLIAAGLCLGIVAHLLNTRHAAGTEVAYTTTAVEFGTLTEVVSATGQVAPRSVSLVSSPLGGQVMKIYPNADFNRRVHKDDPLLELDQTHARIQLQEAEEAVAAARADVQRAEAAREGARSAVDYQKSLPNEVGTKAGLLEADYKLKSAQLAVEAAQLRVKALESKRAEAKLGLDKTIVRSPADGVIVDRKVILGQMVGPQLTTPLFTIASDLSRMQVQAQVAEGDLSKVREGLAASFTVYAYADSNERFEGRVQEIRYLPTGAPTAAAGAPGIPAGLQGGAVFYPTVIDVANRRMSGPSGSAAKSDGPWMLRPGMTATVDITIRQHRDVWKVPTAAISFQLEKEYLTEAAKAKLEQWQTRRNGDDWQVVWVVDEHKRPWPLFVRIGGSAGGDAGIKDGQFNEVLEWDPEVAAKLNPRDPGTYPHVILSAPPANKPGLLDRPARILS